MKIRRADKVQDYDKTWDIFTHVIQTGDTYVFAPNTPKEALAKHWYATATTHIKTQRCSAFWFSF